MSDYINKDSLRSANLLQLTWSEFRGQIQDGVFVTVRVDFDDDYRMRIVSTGTLSGYATQAHELSDDAMLRLQRVRQFVEQYNDGLYVNADQIGRIWWQPDEPGAVIDVDYPSPVKIPPVVAEIDEEILL